MNLIAEQIAIVIVNTYRELVANGMPEDIAYNSQLVFAARIAETLQLDSDFLELIRVLSESTHEN